MQRTARLLRGHAEAADYWPESESRSLSRWPAAALVISLITAHHNSSTPAAQPTSQPTNQPASTADSDKALCEAIAPLIKEATAQGKAFVSLGDYGTPARDAGIPSFMTQTADWVTRAQTVVNQHVS